MDGFFEKLRSMIPDGGGIRMVITRDRDEFIVTAEYRQSQEKGWSSPTMGHGHFSILDDNFFKDLTSSVEEMKPYMFDSSKTEADIVPEKPKTEKQEKPKSPAKLEKKEEPKVATLPLESATEKSEEINVDTTTGEIVKESEVQTDSTENDWSEEKKAEEWEKAKNYAKAEDFVNCVSVLQDLADHFPGDTVIAEKLEKYKAKLPPPAPEVEDF